MARWKDYGILFEEFKDSSLLHMMFVPLMTLRIYVFYTVIAYLYAYPLIQMCLIILLSALTLLYLTLVRPHQHVLGLIEFGVQEVLLLIINICVLILTILDRWNIQAIDHRKAIGNVIVWVNFGCSSGISLYFALKFLVEIVLQIKKYIQSSRMKRDTVMGSD